jgi:hypothetical protein
VYFQFFIGTDWFSIKIAKSGPHYRICLNNLCRMVGAILNTCGFSGPEASSWCGGNYGGTETRIKSREAEVLKNTFAQKLRDGRSRRIPPKKGFKRTKGLHSETGRPQRQCFDAPALSMGINT